MTQEAGRPCARALRPSAAPNLASWVVGPCPVLSEGQRSGVEGPAFAHGDPPTPGASYGSYLKCEFPGEACVRNCIGRVPSDTIPSPNSGPESNGSVTKCWLVALSFVLREKLFSLCSELRLCFCEIDKETQL